MLLIAYSTGNRHAGLIAIRHSAVVLYCSHLTLINSTGKAGWKLMRCEHSSIIHCVESGPCCSVLWPTV